MDRGRCRWAGAKSASPASCNKAPSLKQSSHLVVHGYHLLQPRAVHAEHRKRHITGHVSHACEAIHLAFLAAFLLLFLFDSFLFDFFFDFDFCFFSFALLGPASTLCRMSGVVCCCHVDCFGLTTWPSLASACSSSASC